MPGIAVPIYKQRVQEQFVNPNYRDRSGNSPEAAGLEQVAAGLNKAGQVAGDISADIARRNAQAAKERDELIRKETEKHDAAAVMEAYSRAGAARLAREKELRDKKGRDAIAYSAQVPGLFTKDIERVAETLNDRQKEKFLEIANREHQGFQESVNSWASQQGDVVAQQAFDGARTMSIQKARVAAQNGSIKGMRDAMDEGLQAIDAHSRNSGISPELDKAQRLAFTTEGHAGVLEELTHLDQYDTAQQYLVAHQGDIDAKAVDKIREGIEAAGIRVKSRDIADRIVNTLKIDSKTAWDFPLVDALSAAESNEELKGNIKLYDSVVERIHQANAHTQTARRANDDPRLGRIEQDIYNPKIGKIDESSEDWVNLSDEGKATARARLASKQREDRREQSEYDQILRFKYQQLPPPGQRGLDVDHTPPFRGGSRRLREELKADKQGLLNKSGMSNEESRTKAEQIATERGYGTKTPKKGGATDTQLYVGAIGRSFGEWAKDPKNEGLKPTPEQWSQWDAEATKAVVVADHPIRRWMNKALGTNLEEVETQPAFKAKPLVAPQTTAPGLGGDTVRVLKPDGRVGYYPVGANTDAYLKAHPEIKVIK